MATAPSRHIILIGMMGSGKTTVGRLLARQLAVPFTDADELLESAGGQSIADIINQQGEAAFRRYERQILQQLLALPPQLIATGGGIILSADNRARLKAGGLVVYLQAAAQTLCARLKQDANSVRPLLTADGQTLPERVKMLLAQREPLYRQTAHLTVEQDAEDSAQSIVQQILKALPTAAQNAG